MNIPALAKSLLNTLSRLRLPRLRALPVPVLSFATTVFVTFLIGYFDVLGLHSNTAEISEQIVQSTLAPLYHTAAQKAVTVVLIDADYFAASKKRMERKWPIPVNDFDLNILTPIVEAGPAAVFVDIVFTDSPRYVSSGAKEPQGDDAQRAMARKLLKHGRSVPILIGNAAGPSQSTPDGCSLPATNAAELGRLGVQSSSFADETVNGLRAAPSGLEFVMADWDGTRTDYPIASRIVVPQGSCRTFMQEMPSRFADPAPAAREPQGLLVTPAAALIGAVCRRNTLLPGVGRPDFCTHIKRLVDPDKASGYGLYAVDSELSDQVYIRWGVQLSADAEAIYRDARGMDKCAAQRIHGSFGRLRETAFQLVVAAFPAIKKWLPDGAAQRSCMYIDTISARLVADPRQAGYSESEAAEINARFFKDRIVLIGTDVPFVKDTTFSPVNGEVPGVYIHAMALENMLHYGTKYPRQPHSLAFGLLCLIEGFAAATLVLFARKFVAVLSWMKLVVAPDRRLSIAGITGFVLTLLVLILLILGCALFVCYLIGNQGVVYFASPLFVVLASVAAAIESYRQDYFHPGRVAAKARHPRGPLQH